jgi:prepilin-type N-terminal cleavage/methylation domain-containing protein
MVQKVPKRNGLETGTKTSRPPSTLNYAGRSQIGFGFLELMVAIALIALAATIAIPNLSRLSPDHDRNKFISQVGSLISVAWQGALSSSQMHRLWFNLDKRVVKVEKETEKKDAKGDPIYEPVASLYVDSSYTWPESIQLKEFFIEGKDVMHVPGQRINEVWFYVFPDATAQEVTLNLFDTANKVESEAGSRFSLVLNPFLVKFTVHETFQRA